MLRELGNVFMVKPEVLKSLLDDGYLGRVDTKLLLPYVQMREDYKSAKIAKMLNVS